MGPDIGWDSRLHSRTTTIPMHSETRTKVLNACLILTSLIGYLEWGGDKRTFLFQAEADVIGNLVSDPVSAIHPLTLIPLVGQLMLLVTLFQKRPGRKLTFIGLACLSMLLLFMFFIGLFALKFKIVFSTVPFIIAGVLTVRNQRKAVPASSKTT